MQKLFFLFLLLGLQSTVSWAQTAADHWKQISPDEVVLTGVAARTHEPLLYSAFELDYQAIAAYLKNAPREFTAAARQKAYQLRLPLANGKKATFAVVKVRVMDAALEAQHPEIGTYAGEAINDPGMQVRITVTPGWGFQAFITRADKGIEYIEPVALGQNKYYMVYDRLNLPKDIRAGELPALYEKPPSDELLEESIGRFATGDPEPGDGAKLLGAPVNLKVYKFACAATVEFSQDNGGTKDLVFQKITQFANQLNAIYERDINIRLVLIPESYDIIFVDPATNPYTGTDVGGWMSQNPVVMLTHLGSPDKYDIGHLFARYLGGAAIGVAGGQCCTQLKGRGCSAWYGPPYGDEFFAIVGQEIGHQWRSGHTFNQCFEDAQFDYDSACEPGSGSTIMSYNGACGNNNIGGGGTALYYHACSIAEIRRFYTFQEGATCGSTLVTNNTAPLTSTAYPPVTFIPISTPFELTGTAVDMDGDDMTYCWDEIDLGPTSPLGSPEGSAPLFRWFEPSNTPTRTFPRIQTVIANTSNKTEVLPTSNRDVTFVFVARDNKPGGGGVAWDTVELRSTISAGPFLVSYPNATGVNWKVGEYQTVVWNVANTNKPPVNCKIVNIKLSLDNGLTYPVTLASGVPNTGKYCIQVPDNVGTNLRIRVEAADNVFFDISNIKFTISQPAPSFSLCTPVAQNFACLPAGFSSEVSTVSLAGFSEPITLSATGLPVGAVATFSPNPVQPGNPSTMSVSFPNNSPENTFDVTVQGSTSTASASSILTLTVVNNNFAAFVPTSPVNGAGGVNKLPPLYWNTVPDADYYDVEVATNPSFLVSTIVSTKQNIVVDSFQVPVILQEGKVYYWRVRPKNDCGVGPWSDAQVFVVGVQTCTTKEAMDLPKAITANGTPTIESKITFATGGVISDVNIKKIQGNHTFFKDLEAHLISPAGTDILLWKDKCSGYNGSFNFGMDDGATSVFNCPPPNNGQSYKSSAPLSNLNGQNSTGIWTLRVKDNVISSGGSIAAFELEICSGISLDPPFIVVNLPLTIASGNNAVIGDNLLKAQDSNNGPNELIFTIMTLPTHGQLYIGGNLAWIGMQFSQSDISSGALQYFDFGLNLGEDSFNFSVTDGDGGLAVGTYVIQPSAVGTQSPADQLAFALAPNPASSTALLTLGQALTGAAKVSLINTNGQVVSTWQLPAGANSLRLDLGTLPKGVYAVALEHEQFKFVRKLVLH